jgi:cellobionic acid phosphorylase
VTRGPVERTTVVCDGKVLARAHVAGIEAGRTYRLEVTVP